MKGKDHLSAMIWALSNIFIGLTTTRELLRIPRQGWMGGITKEEDGSKD
jgi:hypothetical protein